MVNIAKSKTTIGDLLDRQAERFGDNDALVHVDWGVRYSYEAFRAECDQVARGLLALGINKGDHVCIWATNYFLTWVPPRNRNGEIPRITAIKLFI